MNNKIYVGAPSFRELEDTPLFNKFLFFHATENSIALFTRTWHLPVIRASSVLSTSYSLSLLSPLDIILPFTYRYLSYLVPSL